MSLYDHWGVTAVWKCGVGELQLVISFTMIEWNLEASVCFEMLRRPYSIVIGIHVTNSPFSKVNNGQHHLRYLFFTKTYLHNNIIKLGLCLWEGGLQFNYRYLNKTDQRVK